MYDKFGLLLRIETAINNPYGFLIRRHGTRKGKSVIGYFPMTKGVTGLDRFAEVARSANHHYLTALSVANDPAPAQKLLRLCTRQVQHNQRSYRGFNPAAEHDITLFKALLQGHHHLHGFRNAAVRALIARIPLSRCWRVSANGHAFMAMAIKHHDHIYLDTLAKAA